MAKGQHTALRIALTPADRATLEAWQRSQLTPVGRCRRARILLLLADGGTVTQVARTVGISRRFVYKWVARFAAQGVRGLVDLQRPGPARRARASEGVQVWHARGDRLVPVAPDVDGLVPGASAPQEGRR